MKKNPKKELFRKAEKITKKSKFTFWVARLFFGKRTKKYFFCWYSYLRWVDDIIDSRNTKYPEKRKTEFLKRQINLVQTAQTYQKTNSSNELKKTEYEELYLTPLNNKLLKTIYEILFCIKQDLGRKETIQTEKNLNYYFEIEAKNCIEVFNYFCGLNNNVIKFQGGIGSKWSHTLRDFISDLNDGTINISKEDMEKFGITSSLKTEIDSPNFRKWVKSKISFAKSQFAIAKNDFYKNPHLLRHKIAFEILLAKYEFYLDRIVKDDYYLRKNYAKTSDNIIFLFCILKAALATFLSHILKRS